MQSIQLADRAIDIASVDREGVVGRLPDGRISAVCRPGYSLDHTPGIVCLTPELPPEQRVYQKTFGMEKPIYLPHELDVARNKHLGEKVFALGMNGFSTLAPEFLAEFGIRPGEYEAMCKALLVATVGRIQQKLSRCTICLVTGASQLGVDAALNDAWRDLNAQVSMPLPLGFSCPRFMLHVEDNDLPVYVAATQQGYSRSFVQALDFLIATGGRLQSLMHDIAAACEFGVTVHMIDVLSELSRIGGSIPAYRLHTNGTMELQNAVAVFRSVVSVHGYQSTSVQTQGDRFECIVEELLSHALPVARHKVQPNQMF